MGEIFHYLIYEDKILNLEGYIFFLILPLKKFLMDFGFHARDDLPHAHWDETEFI